MTTTTVCIRFPRTRAMRGRNRSYGVRGVSTRYRSELLPAPHSQVDIRIAVRNATASHRACARRPCRAATAAPTTDGLRASARNRQKVCGLEARTANQRAIDIVNAQQFLGVRRLHGPTIKDAHPLLTKTRQ